MDHCLALRLCFVQSLSRVWLFATTCSTVNQVSLSFTTSQSLLKLMPIKLVMPSNHLILCFPLFLLLSIFSSIKVFSNKWPLDQVANVLEFQHQSFQRIFRVDFLKDDCFDLLAVQEILKRVLYHHSSKASILWCSAFFMAQLSYPYMATGKIIALTIQTLPAKWCLCFLICCLCLS